MATLPTAVQIPVGTIKQFGAYGPEYEVLGEAPPENGEAMAHIVMVRTGEQLDYPVEAILQDPEAE